jgi:hypothetical protein
VKAQPATAVAEPRAAALEQQLDYALNNLELAQESIADLQLAMDDVGWQRIIAGAEQEFTREGLRSISAACRIYSLKNPLVRRGMGLRTCYVWGQGVEISARANGRKPDEQDVNTVLQQFLDDPGNRRVLFGAEAQQRIERALGTDGNLFLSLWTRPASGKVQVRVLPWDEITDVVRNPDDSSEPWFYHRRWQETELGPDAMQRPTTVREALYPALSYRPKSKPKTVSSIEVRWDAPVRHVKVNDLEGWRFGVPDAYAAIDWARAYKDFLEDWARLVKALSRFAWRTTAKGAGQASAIKAKIGASPARNPATGEIATVGNTAVIGEGQILEAIPKSGATIDSESGRPLAMMVAAALGVPVTMLLADPGQTGARATAETLDQPTELEMESRRSLWSDVLRDVTEHVVRESVRAPKGLLKGKVVADGDGIETVELAGKTEGTVDIAWPDLKDLDQAKVITAITTAMSTMTIPPEIGLRLLLQALGVDSVDEIVDEMTDADGNFLWPGAPNLAAGPDATNRAGNGQDPAGAGTGPMVGDGPPADGTPPAAGDTTANPTSNATTAAQTDPLVTAAIEHATSGDWAALESDAAALDEAAQANAAPAVDLPPQWADQAAVDDDWRIDAALARGADVAAAYGGADGDALRRGFDIVSAEQQILGGQPPTFEAFTAEAGAAGDYKPTVDLDNRAVATAFMVGGYSATVGQPITACPYRDADAEQAALRRVWLTAYLRVRPADATGAGAGGG